MLDEQLTFRRSCVIVLSLKKLVLRPRCEDWRKVLFDRWPRSARSWYRTESARQREGDQPRPAGATVQGCAASRSWPFPAPAHLLAVQAILPACGEPAQECRQQRLQQWESLPPSRWRQGF